VHLLGCYLNVSFSLKNFTVFMHVQPKWKNQPVSADYLMISTERKQTVEQLFDCNSPRTQNRHITIYPLTNGRQWWHHHTQRWYTQHHTKLLPIRGDNFIARDSARPTCTWNSTKTSRKKQQLRMTAISALRSNNYPLT